MFIVISFHAIKMLTNLASFLSFDCFELDIELLLNVFERAQNGRRKQRVWNLNFSNVTKLNLDCPSNLWWK